MPLAIGFKKKKQPWLEKFGVYYLGIFGRRELGHNVFDFTDEELNKRIDRISVRGILLSALTGLVCVWPTVYIDVLEHNEPFLVQYGWVAGATLISVAIEFYLLFIIALHAVHSVSRLINIHAHKNDFLSKGPFNVTNILARAALELPDPEMEILGIDPFERISKRNLFILGLLYKLKIVITNFISKFLLRWSFGEAIAGISVNYIALPVECFWNGVVLHRVVTEARLRLMGFALSNHIADNVLHDGLMEQLSDEAKSGCLRAIGNAVVMAKNYHPNMIVLLLRFQHLLHISQDRQYDNWGLLISCLQKINEKERNFLLDLFTVAVSFDGKISELENEKLKEVYGKDYELYHPRLIQLTKNLRDGKLHAAAELCRLDFVAG
ncbi:MAG: hypothetical protein JST47_00555 [Bacteroidetes bacterium]|nr:hypothetical protein [Bacteroidota bacterium]